MAMFGLVRQGLVGSGEVLLERPWYGSAGRGEVRWGMVGCGFSNETLGKAGRGLV